MAMSLTFLPSSFTTHAILYGCELSKPHVNDKGLPLSNIIANRLSSFDRDAFHPMLLPTIFADIERDKLTELVQNNTFEVNRRMNLLAYGMEVLSLEEREGLPDIFQSSPDTESAGWAESFWQKLKQIPRKFPALARERANATDSLSSEREMTPPRAFAPPQISSPPPPCPPVKRTESLFSVDVWSRITDSRNFLENWRRRLLKMLDQVDELDLNNFGLSTAPSSSQEWEKKRRAMSQSGERIRDMLKTLVDDFDEKIRDCTYAMEGMTVLTQLVSASGEWMRHVELTRRRRSATSAKGTRNLASSWQK